MLRQYLRRGENKKKLVKYFINIIAVPLVPLLFPLRRWGKIKFIRLRSSRIGHLAGNTELFLRRRQQGILKNDLKIIGIATRKPCNEQLLTMIKRTMVVLQIPQPKLVRNITKWLFTHSVLKSLDIVESLPWDSNAYYEMTYGKPCLSFTAEELNNGQELLKKMGAVNEQFICFHARDSAYLGEEWRKGDSYHGYRNCNIGNYLLAAEYFAKRGGLAFRMGAKVQTSLSTANSRIIDYAKEYRSDFGDIFLSAHCKFFLGNTAGLFLIPTVFNVPVALANLMLLLHPPFRKGDLFIPTKFYSREQKRVLSYREVVNSEILFFHSSDEYRKAGIEIIENTPEEILDLAIEMNERIDGVWKEEADDESLQQKFRGLFPGDVVCNGYPSGVGAKFLRKNKFLLE